MTIVMVIFPGLTQLDLTGPYEVFGRLPESRVLLAAEERGAVRSDSGLTLLPDTTFDEAPQADVLFVPGGRGIYDAMQNTRLINFLKQQERHARLVTSVCTGSLVLAAAGLLDGYRATTHWLSLDLLRLFEVQVVRQRVVVDRNRITGAGVTAGIDFGLLVAANLFGEQVAKEIQLLMEYDPAPPFNAGSPDTADQTTVENLRKARASVQQARVELIKNLRKP